MVHFFSFCRPFSNQVQKQSQIYSHFLTSSKYSLHHLSELRAFWAACLSAVFVLGALRLRGALLAGWSLGIVGASLDADQ